MTLQFSGRVRSMMSKSLSILRRTAIALTLFATVMGLAGSPAQARVFVGIGIPFFGPGYYPPPAYYPPPPMYYPPPPVVYAPPQNYTPAPPPMASGGGQACYAGSYVCPMDRPVEAGTGCYCLGNGGQKVWGRAN
jgi:hypothetical protein